MARQGVGAGLADDHRLAWIGVGDQAFKPRKIRLVPSEILVEPDHVEFGREPIGDAEIPAVDEAGRRHEARRVRRAGGACEPGHEGKSRLRVGVLVADAPDDHAGTVPIPRDQFHKLVMGIRIRRPVGEIDRPIDRDLGPEEDSLLVGDARDEGMMRVVGEAQEIRAEFPDMGEAPPDICGRCHPPGLEIVLVHAGAAQEQRRTVQKDTRAVDGDAAETDPLAQRVRAGGDLHIVESRRFGRPEFRRRRNARRTRACDDRDRRVDAEFGDAQARGAVDWIGEQDANVDRRRIGSERDVRAAQEDRRHAHQRDLPMDAAIVEPVDMVHRYALGSATILCHHQDAISARTQRRARLAGERCRRAEMPTDAHAVDEDERRMGHTLEMQELPLAFRPRTEFEVARIPAGAFEIAPFRAQQVPARWDRNMRASLRLVVARHGPLRGGRVVERVPFLAQALVEQVERHEPVAAQALRLAPGDRYQVAMTAPERLQRRRIGLVVEMREGILDAVDHHHPPIR